MVSNDGSGSCSICGRDDCASNQSYAEWVADKEKYLRACGFAISQMMERGSSAVVFGIHSDHPVQVRYEDVLEWINKQLDVIGYSKDGNKSVDKNKEKETICIFN